MLTTTTTTTSIASAAPTYADWQRVRACERALRAQEWRTIQLINRLSDLFGMDESETDGESDSGSGSCSPAYDPTSPTFEPASPAYDPTSPTFEPASPAYDPTSPVLVLDFDGLVKLNCDLPASTVMTKTSQTQEFLLPQPASPVEQQPAQRVSHIRKRVFDSI